MYDKSIIKYKLDKIQDNINKRESSKQFSLTYFSISDSLSLTKQLQERTITENPKKRWESTISNLTQADINFIENQRIICANDFSYWCTRYAFVKSENQDSTTTIDLFSFWISQRIVVDIWAEMEAKFHAIMMLYLKARQLGVSTINELAIAHRVQFSTKDNRVNALIASSDPDKTKKMAGMMELCWDYQPFWLVPEYNITPSKEIWCTFTESKSSITCQHGTAMSGIARGETPSVAHISELPDFSDPSEDVDASLLNAIHERPSTFIVLESTAKGKTGKGEWWWEKWKYAKKWYPRNKTRLRPVFLPWFIGTDIYPTKTWSHQFLPKNLEEWKPRDVTLAHAEKCKKYVNETSLLRKYLGYGWTLPKHQQYWWEFTRQEYEERGDLNKFLEEMPATDEEAFQRSGRGLITTEQAEFLRNHAKPLALYHDKPAVFGIIGDGIPAEHEPFVEEIDQSRPYITIKVEWDSSTDPKIYRFIPLKHDPDIWNNRLFLWEFPFSYHPNSEYGVGVDGALGLEGEGDNSALVINRKMTLASPAEQVAEFVSDSISIAELLPYVLALVTFYSKIDPNFVNQCKHIIETNMGGHTLQHQCRLSGLSNWHTWKGSYQSVSLRQRNTMGWNTNAWTRPDMITQSIRAIKDGAYRINSHHFIEELTNLQQTSDTAKIEAKGKDHDDRCMAGFMCFFSLHDMEIYLMKQGDMRIRSMFQSYGDALPQEQGLIVSLNDAIAKVEDKDVHKGGLVKQYIGNFMLPTLEDDIRR